MTSSLLLAASFGCAGLIEPTPEAGPAAPVEPSAGGAIADDAGAAEASENASPEGAPTPGAIEPETGAWRVAGWKLGSDDGDDFAFWGWDRAGARFAYETGYGGGGGVSCDMEATLTLVDAAADAYVTGAHRVFAYESPEGDTCVGQEPWTQIEEARGPLLEEWGVQAGAVGIRGEVVTEGDAVWLTLPGGGRAEVQLTITGPGREDEPTGAGYRLVLVRDGEALVVESGERLRPWIWDYALEGAFYSEGEPRSAALLVRRTGRDFEGSRQSWMTNGASLPEGW